MIISQNATMQTNPLFGPISRFWPKKIGFIINRKVSRRGGDLEWVSMGAEKSVDGIT